MMDMFRFFFNWHHILWLPVIVLIPILYFTSKKESTNREYLHYLEIERQYIENEHGLLDIQLAKATTEAERTEVRQSALKRVQEAEMRIKTATTGTNG